MLSKDEFDANWRRKSLHERATERAYFIYKETGNEDEQANYFAAIQQLQQEDAAQ